MTTGPVNSRWLVALGPVDYVTLISLLFACSGLVVLVRLGPVPAISVMLFALLSDIADGALARRLGTESDFGRQLDGSIDIVVHLVLPAAILYGLGLTGPLSLTALFAVTAAGCLRLAHFSRSGFVTAEGSLFYEGLPVYWLPIGVAVAAPLLVVARSALVELVVAMGLLIMATLMLGRRRFPKPLAYARMVALLLLVAGLYAWAYLAWDISGR